MQAFKRPKCSLRIATLFFAVIFLIGLIAETSADTKGFDTPQAVFENLVQASNAKDFKKLCSSIAPDDMATINMVMIAGGSMIVAFAQMAADISAGTEAGAEKTKPEEDLKVKKAAEEAKKLEADFKAILKNHKIEDILKDDPAKSAPKDEKEARERLAMLFKDVNQCELLNEMFGFFDKLPGEKTQKSSWRSPECTELKELKIDGDNATAMCGVEKLSFRKFQGRWYINPEEAGRNKKT